VNVHFVPPLVTGTCSVAQFWAPPNVTCALCFCMTGTLSRCIPRPGCNPLNTTTTEAPMSTESSNSSSTSTSSMGMEANHKPTQQEEHVTGSSTAKTTVAPGAASTPAAMGDMTTMPTSLNLVRRRRRANLR